MISLPAYPACFANIELEIAMSNMRTLEGILQRINPAFDPVGYIEIMNRLSDAYKQVMNLQKDVNVNEESRWMLIVVDSNIHEEYYTEINKILP